MVRLQKYLADCGIASRRKSEEYIASGMVTVNGVVIDVSGVKINPDKDEVRFEGEIVKPLNNTVHYMLNKPKGYVCSAVKQKQSSDPVITELIDSDIRIFPVGRLDKNSSGLIIMTNDGELANKLMHPSFGKEKEYVVTLAKKPTAKDLTTLSQSMLIDGENTIPARVIKKSERVIIIILKEGKNRQIRKMIEQVNNRVVSLHRVRINKLNLKGLKPGEYKELLKEDLELLIQ